MKSTVSGVWNAGTKICYAHAPVVSCKLEHWNWNCHESIVLLVLFSKNINKLWSSHHCDQLVQFPGNSFRFFIPHCLLLFIVMSENVLSPSSFERHPIIFLTFIWLLSFARCSNCKSQFKWKSE